ncbi:MAG: HD domain-containing protein, partial [Nitrosopumilus sp.]|nr:HD domain-containing protein [Nitrosopumilus sp.]
MKVLDSIKDEVIKIMNNDTAHDFDHVMRVYNNAQKIVKKENANPKLVLSAALLHDIVSYSKSSKRSKFSSIDSAKKSKIILKKYGFTNDEIIVISDA